MVGDPPPTADDPPGADDSHDTVSDGDGDDRSALASVPEPSGPVRLANVTKAYDDVTALADVSVRFRPGEFHCLVGPNGSGKTTLLRLVLGLTRPTTGRVEVPADARLGVAFQRPSHYEALTVAENLRVFGTLAGADADWVARVREELGLDAVASRVAGELSGGFARKLDVALALAGEPPFVLLDEPLADLDDVTERRLVDLLGRYCDAGGAVVVSTHRLRAFEPAVDHLTVMHRGRVLVDDRRSALEASDLHDFYVERVLAADRSETGAGGFDGDAEG